MFNNISNTTNNRGLKSYIFPQKLWRMVNNGEFSSAIKWNQDGKSFMVFENQLKNLCLGKENKLFYTTQPKSFVRQLHLYGFRKVNKNQFSHKFFQRDHPELLDNIRRSYRQPSAQQQQQQQQQEQAQMQHFHPVTASHSTSDSSTIRTNQSIDCQNLVSSSSSAMAPLASASTAAITVPIPEVPAADHEVEVAMTFATHYDASCAPPITWYETNYTDINYNYNDDTILALYNNDIYPDTCGDNNITL